MSISSVVTRGYSAGVNFIPPRGYSSGSPTPTPTITGGHFLPKGGRHHKRTLSNILEIYNEARELPRKETKELRDAIAEFVEPAIAMQPYIPNIIKIDYEALSKNDEAYEKFSQALANIQKRIEIQIAARHAEDDELLLMAILACSIN